MAAVEQSVHLYWGSMYVSLIYLCVWKTEDLSECVNAHTKHTQMHLD